MRILVVASWFCPAFEFGGPARVLYEIFRRLATRGHEVSVYTTDVLDAQNRYVPKSNPEDIEGMQVYRFPNVSHYLAHEQLIFIAPRMRAMLREHLGEYDVALFHCFYTLHNVWASSAALAHDVPFVVEPAGSLPPTRTPWRSLPKHIFLRTWGQSLIRSAARFVAVSQEERARQVEWGVPSEKINVIANGVSLSELDAEIAPGQFRDQWGVGRDRPLVLFAGRLSPIKGIDLLLRAFARQDEDAVLVIAGPDATGYGQQLQAMADDLGISNRTIFTGMLTRDQVLAACSDADVFVLASRDEGHPVALVEACGMGSSVIATEACNMPEITEWGAGRVIRTEDWPALADALAELLADEPLRRRQGERGREMVKELFTWERAAEMYESCLAEAAGT
ncbi:MAG: glycosyltransferase [Armatimonadota bacterium]|jgi:glycosyltransferase involved in cell wall biosynthesis